MKAPIRMYSLKPIVVHDFVIETPKCMYRLNNIDGRRIVDGSEDHVSSPAKKLDIFDQNCQEIPGMADLEAKQTDILEQLAQLKKQIYSLRCDLNIGKDSGAEEIPASTQCTRRILNKNSLPESLVIASNPSSPPYSLELLQRLLQNQIGLAVTSYLHSSVVSLPEPANRLKESLANFSPPAGIPVISVRLIWKNVNSNSEFLLSHIPISGEVNLLRFLSRLATTNLSYDSDADSVEIDSLLDQCYLLVRAKTKAERTSILQSFSKSLSKSHQWLVGRNRAGIADLAAYSAIRQCLGPNDLGANLTKWYQRCGSLVSF